jgi:hypothetical protein
LGIISGGFLFCSAFLIIGFLGKLLWLCFVSLLPHFFLKKTFTSLSFDNLERQQELTDKINAIQVLGQKGHVGGIKKIISRIDEYGKSSCYSRNTHSDVG